METGTLPDVETLHPWDSVTRFIPEWNRDQNLRSGIKYSAVWFYQEMARRVGQERMQMWVDSLGYGNQDISGGIDRFWLDGGLRITAHEQIAFLRRLKDDQLPFSQRNIDMVKDILINEQTDEYVLRAKTGWSIRTEPNVGWWVGWVERKEGNWFFAINIDMDEEGEEDARKIVVRKVLKSLGVLPAG